MTHPKLATGKGAAKKGGAKKEAGNKGTGKGAQPATGKLADARKKLKKKEDQRDDMQDLKFNKPHIKRDLNIEDIEEKAKLLSVKKDEDSPVPTTVTSQQEVPPQQPGADVAAIAQPGAQVTGAGTDDGAGAPQTSTEEPDAAPGKKRKEVKGDSKGRVRLSAALEATVEYPAWEDFVDAMGIDGMKLIRNILVEKMVLLGRIDEKRLKTPLLKL
ncbi:hypothetical protein PV783_34300 [Chitinophaga sp. CC14]|uniref:hypothetical protein n=1 Tax=Chitinophaga sp. CC14 TaxID=3029199 RepID=UPI003B7FCF46